MRSILQGSGIVRSRLMLAGVIAALVGPGLSPRLAAAQAQPAASYERSQEACRAEGKFNRQLSGDSLAEFVDQCVAEGSGSSASPSADHSQSRRQACDQLGRDTQELRGDQLRMFIEKCSGQ